MKKIILIVIMSLMMLLVPGCGNSDEEVDIYASIYPVYFITQEIVQEKLNVKQVYPTGADVHEYDPANGQEMVKMSRAKIMFYIGGGLESFIEKSHNVFDKSDIKLVELSDYVKLCKPSVKGYDYLTMEELENSVHIADTHIWLDPLRMVTMAEIILENVIAVDPENTQFYKDNANALIQRLRELDNQYLEALSNEELNKIILVDHDSYLYWEERYGLKRIRTRIDNESCDSSMSTINNVIEQARENNIKYIVVTENEIMCNIVNKYKDVLDAKIIELNHLSTLYKEDINKGDDYFTIMRRNLNTLVSILPKY